MISELTAFLDGVKSGLLLKAKMTEDRAMSINPCSWEWYVLSAYQKRELMRFIPVYLFKHPTFQYKYMKEYKIREVQKSLGILDDDYNEKTPSTRTYPGDSNPNSV